LVCFVEGVKVEKSEKPPDGKQKKRPGKSSRFFTVAGGFYVGCLKSFGGMMLFEIAVRH
jgi:hypothetical protein